MSRSPERIHDELYRAIRTDSPKRLAYTRKAFETLPRLEKPRILDMGCGEGGPTAELGRLSRGVVVGIDVSLGALKRLSQKTGDPALSARIHAVGASMLGPPFRRAAFDIVWAEGSAHVIGFEQALQGWRCLIRAGGYLVIHEMTWLREDPPREIAQHWKRVYPGIRTTSQYLRDISNLHYALIDHFELPDDFWWVDFYEPLERNIRRLRQKYGQDETAGRMLDEEQGAVDLYKRFSSFYGSAFFVMRGGRAS